MKKHLLQLLFLCNANAATAQTTDPVFHPINALRPERVFFPGDLVRMRFGNMAELLRFAASEFEFPQNGQLAVQLNDGFVGKTDAALHFTQIVDEKRLLEIPVDSVRMVALSFDPDFRTRHSGDNFFGKINVAANLPKPPDTVAWNRFEPERFVINRAFFNADYQGLAAVAPRAGWFLGDLSKVRSFQAGAWLEVPLSRRAALQAEFSYTNQQSALGRFARSPFEEFTYSLNEWKGRIDLKYYLRKRYQRPYLLAGCFVGRATGQLLKERAITPDEFLGPKTGFGIRYGMGYQFFSGLYGAVSISPVLTKKSALLPMQKRSRAVAFSVGWMIGRR